MPNLAVAAGFVLAAIGYTYFFHLREVLALQGFSVLEFLEHSNAPQNFVHDFPGGGYSSGASLLTWLYIPLQHLTGFSGLTLMTGMIWLEIASVMAAAWMVWRFVDPAADQMHRWGYVWLCLFLVTSSVTSPDLANFKFPYFHGQFYGYADALRLVAIVFALKKEWRWAALMLVIAFTVHPIKTLGAGVFILGAALADGQRSINLKSFGWGVVAAALCAAWAYFWLGVGRDTGVTAISTEQYVAFTRIFQFHWYPVDMGEFGNSYHMMLAPFMALILMMIVSLYHIDMTSRLRRQVLAGYAAVGLLSACGIWMSMHPVSPTFVKLALHRASDLMTLLAPFFIVAALIAKWRSENWLWVALYSAFLIGGFTSTHHMAPGLAIFAVGLQAWDSYKAGNRITILPILAGLIVLAAVIILRLHNPDVVLPEIVTVKRMGFVLAAWGALLAVPYLRLDTPMFRVFCVTCVLFAGAADWSYHHFHQGRDTIAKGRAYYNAQIWARNNTAGDALFMVDPCIMYGWRDFSGRPSIGTPREWFMTGWIYQTDGRVLDRGTAISRALGLNIGTYLRSASEKPAYDSGQICAAAQIPYYDPTRTGIKRVARDFGVSYFVFTKEKSARLVKSLKAMPVFANDYYLIYAAKDVSQ